MIPRLMSRGVGSWVDSRLRLSKVTRHTVGKIFPDHWSFMLGEIALYSFVMLLLTGVYLTLFFEGSKAERVYSGSYAPLHGSEVSAAYASVVELSFDIEAGLLIRQTHHWAALVFIAAIVAHLCRIFFTGAFRRPREINWLIGVTMLLLGILNGFLGYSLPDDLLSGTGLRIAQSVLLSLPIVGSWLQYLAFGGPFPGEELEQRMYAAHILLVPGILVALISVHLAILVRQKHSHFSGPGRLDSNVVGSRMWPTYAFRSLSLFCAVLAVGFGLGGMVQINPVWLWGPFKPFAVTSPAQPDWYVGWLDGSLRLFPPWEFRVAGYLVPSVFWPAVVLPSVLFLGLYTWPWIERAITKDRTEHHVLQRPRDVPGRLAVGVGVLTFLALLLLAGANDLYAREWRIPVYSVVLVMRVATLVLPLIAAGLTWYVARRLRRSEVAHLSDLPASALWPGGHRRGRRPNRRLAGEKKAGAPATVPGPLATPSPAPHAPVAAQDAPIAAPGPPVAAQDAGQR